MKNYYIFICLDGVPILELLLDKNYHAIEYIENINWKITKYIILDFKSSSSPHKVIEKGVVTYQEKVLTKQITYYRIDMVKAHKKRTKQDSQSLKKVEKKIIELSDKLFHDKPEEFLNFIKENKLVPKTDIQKLEKALLKLQAEKEILDSWKNVTE